MKVSIIGLGRVGLSLRATIEQVGLSVFMSSSYKDIRNISLAFLGISKKKDDLTNCPALDLLCRLLSDRADLHVYEPLFIQKRVFTIFYIEK